MFLSDEKKTTSGRIIAPMSGTVISVTEVHDDVFADKVLGDGIAIIPESGKVLSPVDGVVTNVADTYHAFGLETKDGIELLLHIGLDTVELQGKPFSCKVNVGDKVSVGQLLCEVDLQVIREAGYILETPLLITNMDAVSSHTTHLGAAIAGESCLLEYTT